MNQKRALFISIIIIALLAIVIYIATNKSDDKNNTFSGEIQWDIPEVTEDGEHPHFVLEMNGYHITSAILLKDGKVAELSQQAYMDIIDADEFIEPKRKTSNHPLNITEVNTKYDLNQLKRVTQIFFGASFISIKSEAVIESNHLNDEVKQEIDEILIKDYQVKPKGVSYTGKKEYEGLYPAENDTYASILFIPKVMEFSGTYTISEESLLSVSCSYPCVNNQGYLDGIYILVESKNVNNIPD